MSLLGLALLYCAIQAGQIVAMLIIDWREERLHRAWMKEHFSPERQARHAAFLRSIVDNSYRAPR
jgi:hypothetical protein